MSEYTKGPWEFNRRNEDLVGSTGEKVRVYGSGLSFCGLPDDTARANSRLIAAAPELLEVLKIMLQCDKATEVECQRLGLPRLSERWDMAEAIIAKAEGK